MLGDILGFLFVLLLLEGWGGTQKVGAFKFPRFGKLFRGTNVARITPFTESCLDTGQSVRRNRRQLVQFEGLCQRKALSTILFSAVHPSSESLSKHTISWHEIPSGCIVEYLSDKSQNQMVLIVGKSYRKYHFDVINELNQSFTVNFNRITRVLSRDPGYTLQDLKSAHSQILTLTTSKQPIPSVNDTSNHDEPVLNIRLSKLWHAQQQEPSVGWTIDSISRMLFDADDALSIYCSEQVLQSTVGQIFFFDSPSSVKPSSLMTRDATPTTDVNSPSPSSGHSESFQEVYEDKILRPKTQSLYYYSHPLSVVNSRLHHYTTLQEFRQRFLQYAAASSQKKSSTTAVAVYSTSDVIRNNDIPRKGINELDNQLNSLNYLPSTIRTVLASSLDGLFALVLSKRPLVASKEVALTPELMEQVSRGERLLRTLQLPTTVTIAKQLLDFLGLCDAYHHAELSLLPTHFPDEVEEEAELLLAQADQWLLRWYQEAGQQYRRRQGRTQRVRPNSPSSHTSTYQEKKTEADSDEISGSVVADEMDLLFDPDERVRVDLTHLRAYAIDSATASEIDDALSIEYLDEFYYTDDVDDKEENVKEQSTASSTASSTNLSNSEYPQECLIGQEAFGLIKTSTNLNGGTHKSNSSSDGRNRNRKRMARRVEKVWMHVADVSRWIRPGSALSREAERRMTTVYLPDRRIPLFPERLVSRLLSLDASSLSLSWSGRKMPWVYTLSCGVVLDAETGSVLRYEIVPAKIRRVRRLTFTQLDQILNHGPSHDTSSTTSNDSTHEDDEGVAEDIVQDSLAAQTSEKEIADETESKMENELEGGDAMYSHPRVSSKYRKSKHSKHKMMMKRKKKKSRGFAYSSYRGYHPHNISDTSYAGADLVELFDKMNGGAEEEEAEEAGYVRDLRRLHFWAQRRHALRTRALDDSGPLGEGKGPGVDRLVGGALDTFLHCRTDLQLHVKPQRRDLVSSSATTSTLASESSDDEQPLLDPERDGWFIYPLLSWSNASSTCLVTEFMILMSQTVGAFAAQHDIPVLYKVQNTTPRVLNTSFTSPTETALLRALRLQPALKAAQDSAVPGTHATSGCQAYVQVTSPLRRYQDLYNHYRLKAAMHEASLNTQFDGAAQVARELAGIRQLEQMRSLAARSETLRIVRKITRARELFWLQLYWQQVAQGRQLLTAVVLPADWLRSNDKLQNRNENVRKHSAVTYQHKESRDSRGGEAATSTVPSTSSCLHVVCLLELGCSQRFVMYAPSSLCPLLHPPSSAASTTSSTASVSNTHLEPGSLLKGRLYTLKKRKPTQPQRQPTQPSSHQQLQQQLQHLKQVFVPDPIATYFIDARQRKLRQGDFKDQNVEEKVPDSLMSRTEPVGPGVSGAERTNDMTVNEDYARKLEYKGGDTQAQAVVDSDITPDVRKDRSEEARVEMVIADDEETIWSQIIW